MDGIPDGTVVGLIDGKALGSIDGNDDGEDEGNLLEQQQQQQECKMHDVRREAIITI